MSRGKTIGLWVLSGLLGALFLLAGFGKVTSQPGVIQMFRAFGYPDGFYMLIGVVELFGAVALLVPRMAPYGAVALMVVMIGATYTHVVVGDPITFALLRPGPGGDFPAARRGRMGAAPSSTACLARFRRLTRPRAIAAA